MKAFVIDEFKTPGSLRDIPEKPLDDNGIAVEVHYAGVNPVDWKVREGQYKDKQLPLVLGQDFSGTVKNVKGDSHASVGQRVFGCARLGAYAEETTLPNNAQDSPYAPIPDGLSDELAAALPTPGLTALASLAVLDVGKDTKLLVIGAAGAVGSIALQTAVHRGARVTGVAKPGQAASLRARGIDDVIETDGSAVDAVQAKHREPFDVVLDLVSDKETLKNNAPLVRPGGKLVTTIYAADEQWFKQRDITATNIIMNKTPQSSPEGLSELAKLFTDGVVQIDVAETTLDEAGSILDKLEAGKLPRKYVLHVDHA
jgi:NADPH:quinone reductase-like Zn-dependent oxidoreductase